MHSLARLAFAALLGIAALSRPALAAVEDLPGMDTASDMKEWLKLSDAQVAQVKPVVARRLQRVDAAVAKVESAPEPDVMAFIEELGAARKEFDDAVAKILTPPQAQQWASFKAALEQDIAAGAAKKQLARLQPVMQLTDAQAKQLLQPFAVATKKKIDVFRQLADGSRISMRDKMKAKRAVEDINAELDKAMAAVCSPAQIQAYKAATQKQS